MDWDRWRAEYDSLSVKQHQDFYNEVYKQYPSQRHFDLGALLDHIDAEGIDTVVELGGWTGELAAAALHLRPLKSWQNFELCPTAALASIPRDPRYRVNVTHKWFWELDEPPKADCFVASHTIEHLSEQHLDALFARLDYPTLFLDAPLPLEKSQVVSWRGHTSTHILPLSWADVIERLTNYDLIHRHWRDSVHTFRRRT